MLSVLLSHTKVKVMVPRVKLSMSLVVHSSRLFNFYNSANNVFSRAFLFINLSLAKVTGAFIFVNFNLTIADYNIKIYGTIRSFCSEKMSLFIKLVTQRRRPQLSQKNKTF